MLAFIYLAVSVYLGDLLCRRFYRFVSLPHRWAAAFLTGVAVSSWFTYLAGFAFKSTERPLLWADILYFIVALAIIFFLSRRSATARMVSPRAPGSSRWDWVTVGALFLAACILLVGTLNVRGGKIHLTGMEFGDFAPQSAIAQSFALGHNFPTEYPHYAGQPSHYHFLFFFQVGNLEFLGLNLGWAVDLLSVLGLTSMLALVMALGELLFNSRVVGRVGAALFFFHGSPMFLYFLQKQSSLSGALHAILHLENFLPSGYPYRGETWGIWSQIVFVNQRHLPSAIGIMLLVLIFVVERYRANQQEASPSVNTAPDAGQPAEESTTELNESGAAPIASRFVRLSRSSLRFDGSFIFSGILLGALPLWNAPVFLAAAAILAVLFVLFPLRGQMMQMAVMAGILGYPQLRFLSSGELISRPSPFHWGFIIDDPTVHSVINYIAFTFGLKWPVIILALLLGTWFQRRFFLALCGLFLLTFCTQLSVEALANRKFLNIWLIGANLFAGYGLLRLWKWRLLPALGPAAAVILTAAIVCGGAIDYFPIYNSSWAELDYKKDPLAVWVRTHTKRDAVFLTNIVVNHPILLAGRKVYFGWPYYAWSAGYDLGPREAKYVQMFESKNPRRVFELLKENHIDYVAFDDGVRHGEKIRRPNEQLYARYFKKVFVDTENRYGRLVIYKVPDSLPAALAKLSSAEPPHNAFEGGRGNGEGQFDNPHGLTTDRNGNLYVADTNNERIQKFSPNGTFMTSIGSAGIGYGQFGSPSDLAIDRPGNIYVTEAANHRVQRFTADGTFVAEWRPGLYGPQRIALGPDNRIYVVDQGGARIVKLSVDGEVLLTWGSKGSGDGQFNDHTSVTVDPATNKVYVADPRNKRIQVFDAQGKFLSKWPVPEWGPFGFEDVLVDAQARRLYGSSANMSRILVFDLQGNKLQSLEPNAPDKLEGATALALSGRKLYVLCTGNSRIVEIDLGAK